MKFKNLIISIFKLLKIISHFLLNKGKIFSIIGIYFNLILFKFVNKLQ